MCPGHITYYTNVQIQWSFFVNCLDTNSPKHSFWQSLRFASQWDPLELAQWAPLDHLRKAELANGRSAMLAVVGWTFPQFWTLEGPVKTTDPIKAFFEADTQWWAQFIIFCATIEGIKYRGEMEGKSFTGEIDKEACIDWTGNWAKMTDTQKEDMAMKELKNARLAMIGIAGYFSATFIPGSVPLLNN